MGGSSGGRDSVSARIVPGWLHRSQCDDSDCASRRRLGCDRTRNQGPVMARIEHGALLRPLGELPLSPTGPGAGAARDRPHRTWLAWLVARRTGIAARGVGRRRVDACHGDWGAGGAGATARLAAAAARAVTFVQRSK